MPHYLRAGGYTTWILLVLGLVLVVTAIRFARSPSPRRLAFLRALSVAYVLFTLGGVATNLTTVFYTVVRTRPPGGALDTDALLFGLGEAITPAGMGLTILGLTWLLVAVGVRRAHEPD
ncbi:MAG: hypothetical protein R3B06_23980 [Kofleriaceae bacterium]